MGRPALATRETFEATEGREALAEKRDSAGAAFIQKVQGDLAAYLEASGKSQSDVARAVGLSATVISQFLTGKYAGAGLNVARRLAAYLSLEARRTMAPRDPVWVMTRNAKEVLGVLAQCHELRDFGMIYGAAGAGKTRTAQRYKEENPDTILITCTRAIRHPRAFLRHLAMLENVKAPISGAMDALFEGVLMRLRGSGRILVVDEAQALDYGALELIRSLHDLAGIGVVLMGNELIWQMLHSGRTRAQYEQLASRIGIRRCLQPGFPKGDVEAVARQYVDGADGECIAYLGAKAGGVGGLRSVVKLCRTAFHIVADPRGETRAVTKQDLEQAAELLG
jgi:hypothetical protein